MHIGERAGQKIGIDRGRGIEGEHALQHDRRAAAQDETHRRIGVALVRECHRISAQEGLRDAGDQRPLALMSADIAMGNALLQGLQRAQHGIGLAGLLASLLCDLRRARRNTGVGFANGRNGSDKERRQPRTGEQQSTQAESKSGRHAARSSSRISMRRFSAASGSAGTLSMRSA